MSLKIRRGTNADRLTITPLEGELIYTTDNKNLYIGDGTTVGGKFVTGVGYTGSAAIGYTGSASTVVGYTGSAGGGGTGNGYTGSVGYTGSAGANGGTLTSNLNTSTFNITNGSTLSINGSTGAITTNGLTFGSNSVVSGGPIIELASSHNFINVSSSFNNNSPWINFYSVSTSGLARAVSYSKSRGSLLSPAIVNNGDELGLNVFLGYTGSGFAGAGSISSVVDGTVSNGIVPGKILMSVTNNIGSVVSALSVRSTQIEMSVPPIVPTYTDNEARDSAIPSPSKGMIIVVGTNFYGYNGTIWNQLNN